MIVEIPQLINCFISTKRGISDDHAATPARAPHVSLRTGHHAPLKVNGIPRHARFSFARAS
jgi:hypothetical protein